MRSMRCCWEYFRRLIVGEVVREEFSEEGRIEWKLRVNRTQPGKEQGGGRREF